MKWIYRSMAFLVLISCQEKETENGEVQNFSIVLKDSIVVDFLGDYELKDYEPGSDRYLLRDYREGSSYLEVDGKGTLVHQDQFTSDGVDAVGYVLGMGYFQGAVTVLSETKGYLKFKDSKKVGEIPFHHPFIPYLNYPKLGVFEYGDYVYYPNLISESILDKRKDGSSFFEAVYHMPVLQGQNLATGDTLSAMKIPDESELLDGKVHGMVFPVYSVSDTHVVFSPWIGNRLYVYRKDAGRLVYETRIVLEDPDFVHYEPLDTEDPGEFFIRNQKHSPGVIEDVLILEDYYLAVYKKGIEEIRMPQREEGKEREFFMQIEQMNPYFAAVFDREFKQLASGIPFPENIRVPRVVNASNEIVVSKNPNLSETEDDGIVLYKLTLEN
ncbi:hypothetical protein [Algoriphagus vanfongensis]|uniref:hypothetical protein n=1 Tax=Algoriphagus vanfongensis TaxID=426371 RepID=UPI00047BA473|nr:hypothetical protein [Algoriphagus vanfongensis]